MTNRATAILGLVAVSLLWVACADGSRAEDADAGAERDPGARHVDATCVGCHPGARLDAVVRKRVEGRDAGVALDAFLAQHHVPDATLRADVVAYLLARVATPPASQ